MKLYNSFIKKSSNQAIEDIILVKNGFSFPAFFFNSLWFLYKKMWKEFVIILLASFVLIEAVEKMPISELEASIFILGFSAIIAINANHLYLAYLKRQNYEFAGYVFGKNKEEAKLRFIHNIGKEDGSGSVFSNAIFDIKPQKGKDGKEQDSYFTI